MQLIDFLKIFKFVKDVGLLIKGDSETAENELKGQKGGLLGMFAATLGASLLRNMFAVKEVIRAGKRKLELRRICNAASSFN